MADEVLSTGEQLLSTGSGGGSSDGKVKCVAEDTAGYLVNKIYSSNDSIDIEYIAAEKALSITMNSSYEAVISPATNFPIMDCNATYYCPRYVAGQASVNGFVTKINLPSGYIDSVALFGGQNSSNNKHLSVALYGSNTDNVAGAIKFADKVNMTASDYLFDISTDPMHISKYKFYWIMWVLTAESDGGDAVNGRTTSITGAGVGEWPKKAGIGYINNPFSSGMSFADTFNYTINYMSTLAFPYVQLNIVK